MTIAEALDAERLRLGLSVKELARRAEMRLSVAQSILSGGTQNPGVLTLQKVLCALGQDLTWLHAALTPG